MSEQITDKSLASVNIEKTDIESISGKGSEKIVASM